MQIVGLANGDKTPFEGMYLVKWDPHQPEDLRVTWFQHEAKQFKDLMEAMEYWKQVDPARPIRSDGKPNRPLTAFTVEIRS